MTKANIIGGHALSERVEAHSLVTRSPPMVKLFALVGVLISLEYAHVLVQWVLSPDFRPAPVGPDVIPHGTLIGLRAMEAFFALGSIAFLWFRLIKPWYRDGKVSWDGLFMLAMLTMWVQDPMVNYFNYTFMYNAYFVNMGSWATFLPGWQSPRQNHFPEPIFLMGGVYLWITVVNVVVFAWVMGKLRVWLPRMTVLGHLPFAYACLCVIDLLTDIPGPWQGFYAYAAGPRLGTVWAGTPQQLPLYTVFAMSFLYLILGLLRYYRNDRGESWAERGVSAMKLPEGAKTALRFFALVAFCNLSYFVNYFMPYNWLAMQADSMPKYPSYMRVDVCGHGTPYACPSREVPIPSKTSLAIGPDDVRLTADAKQN